MKIVGWVGFRASRMVGWEWIGPKDGRMSHGQWGRVSKLVGRINWSGEYHGRMSKIVT